MPPEGETTDEIPRHTLGRKEEELDILKTPPTRGRGGQGYILHFTVVGIEEGNFYPSGQVVRRL